MSGPLKYDYSKLKGNPADAPGLSSYLAGLYLPLSGAVPMAGALDMGGFNFNNAEEVNANFVNAGGIDATTSLTLNSVPVATTEYVDDEVSANGVSLQAFASNASNLTSGTVADARLSSNVPLKNAANTFTAAQSFGSTGQTSINASGQLAVGGTQTTFGPAGSGRSFINTSAGLALGSGLPITWSTNVDAGAAGSDASIRRNSTGPTLETRAAGGLKVCIADGSALAAVACGQVNIGTQSAAIKIITDPINGSLNVLQILPPLNGTRVYVGSPTQLAYSLNLSNVSNLESMPPINTAVRTVIGGETSPSFTFISATTTGIYAPTTTSVGITAGGIAALLAFSQLVRLPSNSVFGWASGSAHSTNITSGFSQVSAGVVALGNGTAGNASGSLNLANLTASGNILPATHNTSDLGSSGVRFKTGYFSAGVTAGLQSNFATVAAVTINATGDITAGGYIDAALRSFTVAGLPLASASTRKQYWVTDSTLAMTSANYGSTVSGGGSNGARVISDGTNWIIA